MPSYRHRKHVALALRLILGTSILAAPAPAVARRVESSGGTERQKRTQARALFAQAETKHNLGQFGEALDLYAKAYEVLPLPGFLFNIGQCHRGLGSHNQALLYFHGYLRSDHKVKNRELVERLIALSENALKAEQDAERARKLAADRQARDAATLRAAEAAAQRATAGSPEAVTRPAEEDRRDREPRAAGMPVYRKWWFWTAIAAGLVAVVATGVGVGLGTRTDSDLPSGSLGTIDAR